MRQLIISTGSSRTSNKVRRETLAWSDLVDRCREPIRTHETFEQFQNMTKADALATKDVGFFIGGEFSKNQRVKSELTGRDVIVLDLDHCPHDWEFDLDLAYSGFEYFIYSTHSHCPEEPRLRLVLPCARKLTREEYEPVSRAIADMLDINWFDDTTFQVARIMYWPSASSDGDYVFQHNKGAWVDPQQVFADAAMDDWRDVDNWPRSERQADTLRHTAEKAIDPRKKTNVVGAFCRAYTIQDAMDEFIPDAYEPVNNDRDNTRYTYTGSTTCGGAIVYDDLWLYSHHEKDPCSMTLVNAFDLVRLHKFGHLDNAADPKMNIAKRESYKQMLEFVQDDKRVGREQLADTVSGFDDIVDAATADAEASGDVGSEDEGLWLDDLDLDNQGIIRGTLRNIRLIVENDPEIKGNIAVNDFMGLPRLTGDVPWTKCYDTVNGDQWTDDDELRLRLYIGEKYNFEPQKDKAMDACRCTMLDRSFHPVKEYLNGLDEWDGEDRLDTLLIDYLGAEDNIYTRAVSRKFMCAAVARIMDPGVKFDQLVVLEGPQGQRKSTFVEALAVDPKWFTDNMHGVDSRQVLEAIQGSWFVEISELAVFGKSQIEHIKGFLSRRTDKARMAYARHVVSVPRQCVFIGTTNDSEYLKDDTGNRRTWPVSVTVSSIDLETLKANRDQLWAEALVKYGRGEPLWLEDEASNQLAQVEQERRRMDDGLSDTISAWLEEPADPGRYSADVSLDDGHKEVRDRAHYLEIWNDCLGMKGQPSQAENGRIRRAVDRIDGWEVAPDKLRFGKITRRGIRRIPETLGE